jgi:hypothetical protein
MPEIDLESNVGRQLEQLVDSNGLRAVVEALSMIAYAKAQHIDEAWQDPGLARLWKTAARRLWSAAESPALAQLWKEDYCKAMGRRPEPEQADTTCPDCGHGLHQHQRQPAGHWLTSPYRCQVAGCPCERVSGAPEPPAPRCGDALEPGIVCAAEQGHDGAHRDRGGRRRWN